jgi:hypothetical protein
VLEADLTIQASGDPIGLSTKLTFLFFIFLPSYFLTLFYILLHTSSASDQVSQTQFVLLIATMPTPVTICYPSNISLTSFDFFHFFHLLCLFFYQIVFSTITRLFLAFEPSFFSPLS